MSIFHIINLEKKIMDTGILDFFLILCKFTIWSGETPTGNFSDVFFFILDKNNEGPDWMTDLKHTNNAW
jgi:hypothetical protein